MEKILMLFAILLIFSCKKAETDLLLGDVPEERIGLRLEELQSKLTEVETGWKATLTTTLGGGYGFYMKFNKDQSVSMIADLDVESASTESTSTYRTKWVMNASLIFDTYNYITKLQDPTGSVFGGIDGAGLASDIEFEYLRSSSDSIFFRGKRYENLLVLVKATNEERATYLSGGYLQAIERLNQFLDSNPYTYFDVMIDGKVVRSQISFDENGKVIDFSSISENEEVVSSTDQFSYTLEGGKMLIRDSYIGKVFTDVKWVDDVLYIYDNQGSKYEIKSSPLPVHPLRLLIGSAVKKLTIPGSRQNMLPLASWSGDYIARRSDFVTKAKTGGYNLDVDKMMYEFDGVNKKIALTVDIYQNSTLFIATFSYTYTINANGQFKFNGFAAGNGNASIIINNMSQLSQRISNDNFTIEYFNDPAVGLMAQFKSVEHPDFYFTAKIG